jgi:hypothetical protein
MHLLLQTELARVLAHDKALTGGTRLRPTDAPFAVALSRFEVEAPSTFGVWESQPRVSCAPVRTEEHVCSYTVLPMTRGRT